jgi:hypothetical protein
MKFITRHWNCSSFADFVRGEQKPFALEWDEWDEWKQEQIKKRPIRYWLAEKGLSKLQSFFSFPFYIYREIKYYVRNRWIDKTHYLQTGLKPGYYYEFDDRILHALFNELVIFVETEYAGMAQWNNTDKKYKIKNGRCSEAGLDYLNWECELKYDSSWGISKEDPEYGKSPPQALAAQKIKELYVWWKEIRPNKHLVLNEIEKIEQSYLKEDTKMLIDLIKIRSSIWT